jgi:hypothetical protein
LWQRIRRIDKVEFGKIFWFSRGLISLWLKLGRSSGGFKNLVDQEKPKNWASKISKFISPVAQSVEQLAVKVAAFRREAE